MKFKQDYFGFVYIWFDRTNKMFYIGSHMGSVDDGYICSSKWMKDEFHERPHDFTRKILHWHPTAEHRALYLQEQRWLDLIKDEKIKAGKYYNLKKSIGTPKGHKFINRKKPICTPTKGRIRPNVTAANLARKPVHCNGCGQDVAPNLYPRWHGENCLMTPEKISKMREMHSQGLSLRAIGRDFNITHKRVSNILSV